MGRIWRKLLLLFCLIGVLLTACELEETELPTRAAVVQLLPAAELTQTAVFLNLPPTWTPSLSATPEPFAAATAVALPLRTATAVVNLPTNTPRPTRTPTPTPTSNVTATPYVSFIPTNVPPSAQLGPSKLGLHVIQNNDFWINEFVRLGQPAVIKALDNFGYVAEIKALSPRTIVVGRFNHEGQNYVGIPEEAARDFVNAQLAQYLANPAVDYWEGWNEPDPNLEHMAWYARFEQERVRLLAQYGLRAAIGGFSTGVPELDEFVLFLPAIETAIQYRGILTLHEYSAPDLTYLFGSPLPGYPAYADRGALMLRYRWYYREILEPAGLVIPLVISEAGVDGVIGNRPGPQGLGWRDFQSYWVQQGWGRNGAEAFINQLAWYDAETRRDGYVIGFTIFTAGAIGQWMPYDINPILPELTAYMVSQRYR